MSEQRYRGTRDLLPDDMRRFRLVEDVFRNTCRNWCFQEVRTPTLEYLHLFTATGTLTPARLSKLYSFLDWDGWSGERIVLRPDGTIPVARLFIESLSKGEPARLFYTTNIFAFDESGKETREQWQCGAEYLGNSFPTADAEVVMLATEVIQSLGFNNARIRLSHAGLVKALIKQLDLSPEQELKILDQILEGDWRTFEEATSAIKPLGDVLGQLLGLRGNSASLIKNIRASYPAIPTAVAANLDNFIAVTELLDNLQCKYEINLSSVHGFEYYTGICFQAMVDDVKVVGGGRYDDLIPLMNGGNVPACGFALYLDRITGIMPVETGTKTERGVTIRREGKSVDSVRACFQLAMSLRQAGYIAEIDCDSLVPNQGQWRWLVTVREREPGRYTIVDRDKNLTMKAASFGEVMNAVSGVA